MSTPTVMVGATVSVLNEITGVARTWTIVRSDPSPENGEITEVVPAPQAAKPAPEALPMPDVPMPQFGRGQDADYEEWVRRHPSGYVAKKADRAADGYILHHAECPHLGLHADFTLRTASPRRCCSSLRVLENWCREQTDSAPYRCATCFS